MLLSGAGKLFCGGGDLRSMRAAADRGAYVRQLVDAAHAAVRELAALAKPVVVSVHGPAAGAGLSLLLLSDIVLAAPSASFTTAYTSVGLTPDCGQSWMLPRVIGLRRALDLTLIPRRLSAEEALELGIVSRVVDAESLTAEAHAVAERLAHGPAAALGAARWLLRAGFAEGFAEHLDREADAIARRAASDEAGTLISEFLVPRN
ncbi:hypothetical protein GCM10007977_077290 [Dactylosporangium sucinum]|uniref:Enoyl-CoA hydratase n=1 Tax=Dactylosporangium sucinum TaxID=1424081 RepID=A0A917X484_9ACTN|nr:hypothetical protein GCM10007977_077290 [Dactylosporangium sucinum]